ncbi:MAG: sigma-70 family RNA polymerase sigma factor [Actinomycetia bacterium]|nr:sigma-70 family RNA polymerase sigma factor [Actinomycetes bacterium]
MNSEKFVQELASARPGLRRYALTLTSDETLAEDLVSETVVRALEKQQSFRGDAALATWLHRILHNLAVDRFRTGREVPSEDILSRAEADWRSDAYTVDVEAVTVKAESVSEVRDALVHLPFKYRSAIILHDGHGLTNQEVAQVQGIGLSAAKQRVRRGRMMLVSLLAHGAERQVAVPRYPLGCWAARSQVSEYLDDDLVPSQRAVLEAHLSQCPSCPSLYAALVTAQSAMKRAGRDPDSVIEPSIAERLHTERQARSRRTRDA